MKPRGALVNGGMAGLSLRARFVEFAKLDVARDTFLLSSRFSDSRMRCPKRLASGSRIGILVGKQRASEGRLLG